MKKILVIPTLSPDDFSETIHLVELKSKKVERININNSDLKDYIGKMVDRGLTDKCLPYGYTKRKQLVPFFAAPHGVTPCGVNEVYIFYQEAPIFRKLNIQTWEVSTLPAGVDSFGFDGDKIFPSTAMSYKDGRMFLFANSAKERYQHLLGKIDCMTFSLYEFIPETKKLAYLDGPFEGLTENIHQMAISESGILVFLDMTLAVKGNFRKWENATDTLIYSEEFQKDYAPREFPKGNMFLYDMNSKRLIKTDAEIPATAHVVFDPRYSNVFYVSMHNISKFMTNVVFHGPGKIVKYEYKDGKISKLGCFTQPNFLRITTHKVFKYRDKALMAVTVFPNTAYLIDCDTMNLYKKVELFQCKLQHDGKYPFLSITNKDKRIALYLDISDDGEWIYLSGPQYIYYLNVESGKIEDSFQFSETSSSAVSHNCLIYQE